MHLVDEQNGAASILAPQLLGRGNSLANIFHPGQHRIDGNEVGAGGVSDDLGQGGFARSRWAKENQRRELICLNRPPQEPPWPHHRILTDELVQCTGPHPGRQGSFPVNLLLAMVIKEIHIEILMLPIETGFLNRRSRRFGLLPNWAL
jgi:hypothetical protein